MVDLPQLFERIPDTLLSPLASPNRRQHWNVLFSLYEARFGPDAPIVPAQGFSPSGVLADLRRFIADQDAWERDEDDATEGDADAMARAMLARLIKTGWLREERIGIERRLNMMPNISRFMGAMVGFVEEDKLFVGCEIKIIRRLLDDAIKDSDAASLRKAARSARELVEKIRSSGIRVREIMDSLQKETATHAYVSRFFKDYVQNIFIGDYKELRTINHPLATCPDILRRCDAALTTSVTAEAFVASYAHHYASNDMGRAQHLFFRDIRRLQDLEFISEHLDRLDDEIFMANHKALVFLDYHLRTSGSIGHRLDETIRALAECDDAILKQVAPMPPGPLFSWDDLPEPKTNNRRAAPTIIREQKVDERTIERRRLLKARAQARQISPVMVADFMASQGAVANKPLSSAAVTFSDVEDIVVFQSFAKAALHRRRRGARVGAGLINKVGRGVDIRPAGPGGAENPFIRGQGFIVTAQKENA